MPSSWESAVLPGNQGAPIIAVYYFSHFPDSHIKQLFNPFDPPRFKSACPHIHSWSRCVGVCGPLDNQVWATPVVRNCRSVRQPRVETLSDGSQCCWSDRDREGLKKARLMGEKEFLWLLSWRAEESLYGCMVTLMHAIFLNLSPLPANSAVIKTFIAFLLTFTFFSYYK